MIWQQLAYPWHIIILHLAYDKMVVANQLVVDKLKKTAVVIDAAIPNDSDIRKKDKKIEKY